VQRQPSHLSRDSFQPDERAPRSSYLLPTRLSGSTGRPNAAAMSSASHEGAATRLVGALLLEQNDKWATTPRYMTLETLGTISDTAPVSLPAMAV
jgi:hypothetical protein